MERLLQQIIEGVSNTHGEDFFNAITLQLAQVIDSDYTFIARLDTQAYISKTIALVADGTLLDNFEYSLEYTPCANVAESNVCIYPNKVTSIFPKDQLLIDMEIEAYLGTPLFDSSGNVIGLIVALYREKMDKSDETLTLFRIFSGRIAAEMERIDYQQELLALNNTLEQRVFDRTAELNQTLESLKSTQEKLIESEKLAALGNLVASVAHEVNTPLGVAITGQSLISDALQTLEAEFTDQNLTVEKMKDFFELSQEASPLISENLQRAKNLINNFKNTAADQNSDIKETINIKQYYEQVFSTLKPMMKRKSVNFSLDIPDDIEVSTFPGVHGQVITNLVSNSVRHAFSENATGSIKLKARIVADTITMSYQDDGKGLTTEAKEKIFQPFFTTARGTGGTGLGMAIAYNLVKQKLTGDIRLVDSTKGFHLEFMFPKQL
jgi:signal transduction histidine kinase